MQQVREFLDGLDEALTPTPGANLNTKHYDAFLVQAEALWAQHREAAVESVDCERQELELLGVQLAQSIRSRLPTVRKTLTRRACLILRHLADPSTPLPTADSGLRLGGGVPVRYSLCSEEELEWLRGQGPDPLSRKARRDIYRWRRTIQAFLRKFEDGPLKQPLWLSVGDRGRSGTPWIRQNALDTGLWSTNLSPWQTDALAALGSTDSGTLGIPPASVAPPSVVYATILDECWHESLSDLPLREIGRLHQRQSASPWVACQILEILLGPLWHSFAGGARAADACAGEWAQQVSGPLITWCDTQRDPADATQIPWLIGPAERGESWQGRDYRALHRWRTEGSSISNTAAEPYALMVAYCLERLAGVGEEAECSPQLGVATSPQREQPEPALEEPAIGKDGTWLRVRQKTYQFSKGNQATTVLALFNEWMKSGNTDGCGLAQETLGDAAGSAAATFRVAQAFSGHATWKEIIGSPAKGVFALYLNSSPPGAERRETDT